VDPAVKKYLAEIGRKGGHAGKGSPRRIQANRRAAEIRWAKAKGASKLGREPTLVNSAPVLEPPLLVLKRRIGHMNIRHDEQLLASLDHREREIIYDRFVNGKTLQEISNKFGLTRERIRQIEENALRKINRGLSRTKEAESGV
jgi:DNA-directed RNA polymerase specialized sigma24 family protein